MPATELALGGVDLDDTLSALGMLPSDPTLRLRPGRLLVGGAAAVLAGLAGVLTAIASRSVPPTAA